LASNNIKSFEKLSDNLDNPLCGIRYSYYEGDWDSLPDFNKINAVKNGLLAEINFSPRRQVERFGFLFQGFIKIETAGVYRFSTESDDGSRLYIADKLVVDNDGLHGIIERSGIIALSAGYHPVRIDFFEKTGGDDLKVYIQPAGKQKVLINPETLFYVE